MAEVTFDYQNLMEVEGGLQNGELDELEPRLREAAGELLGDAGRLVDGEHRVQVDAGRLWGD